MVWTRAHEAEQPCSDVPVLRPGVAELVSVLAALGRDPATGCLDDAAALLRAAETLQGLALRELAQVDRARTYTVSGNSSAAGWVRDVLTISDDSARAQVRLARRLDGDLLALARMLEKGTTTVGHVRAVVAGVRGIRPEVLAASIPAVCAAARVLDPRALGRELRERALAVSPELAREQERRQRERRGFWLDELPDGSFAGKGTLTPEQGQALRSALDALVHGDRRTGDERDLPMRRADALVALATHALGCVSADLPTHAGTRPQVHVLVTLDRLAATGAGTMSAPRDLRDAATVPAATFPGARSVLGDHVLLRLLCDADVGRVLLDADGRVLDLGRTTRTVSTLQWRALLARDQYCVAKGCRRPPGQCVAHHVRFWSRGGHSDLSNYVLLCHAHHHEVHDRDGWLQHRDGRWLTPEGYAGAAAA